MANRVWNFDGKDVLGTDGAVVEWEDNSFFTLTYKGEVFHGELMEDRSEDNRLKIKINHRVFEVKKKGELDDLIASLGLDKPKIKKLKELQVPMTVLNDRIVQEALERMVSVPFNPPREVSATAA